MAPSEDNTLTLLRVAGLGATSLFLATSGGVRRFDRLAPAIASIYFAHGAHLPFDDDHPNHRRIRAIIDGSSVVICSILLFHAAAASLRRKGMYQLLLNQPPIASANLGLAASLFVSIGLTVSDGSGSEAEQFRRTALYMSLLGASYLTMYLAPISFSAEQLDRLLRITPLLGVAACGIAGGMGIHWRRGAMIASGIAFFAAERRLTGAIDLITKS